MPLKAYVGQNVLKNGCSELFSLVNSWKHAGRICTSAV